MSETPETSDSSSLMPWRTVIFLLALAVLAPVSALGLLRFGDAGGKAFDSLVLLYFGLGGVQGIKTTIEHAAGGTGLKGAWRAISSDAKPGDPAPAPAAARAP